MIKPEFSRAYEVTRLTEGETNLVLEATAEEKINLAQRFNLEDVETLIAKLHVTVDSQESLIQLTGSIEADITQACIVTLEPVTSKIEVSIIRHYTTAPVSQDSVIEVDLSQENDDSPEPIEGEIIDFGEIVTEQFSLEIDPFPRSPGSEFTGFSSDTAKNSPSELQSDEASNPFAILAQLKGSSEN